MESFSIIKYESCLVVPGDPRISALWLRLQIRRDQHSRRNLRKIVLQENARTRRRTFGSHDKDQKLGGLACCGRQSLTTNPI